MTWPSLKFEECTLKIVPDKNSLTFDAIYIPEDESSLVDGATLQECVFKFIADQLGGSGYVLDNPVFELQARLVDLGYNIHMYADFYVVKS